TLICQSNLRQWALAANVYAHDNHLFLPRRGQGVQPVMQIDRPSDWFNALPPLMRTATYSDLAAQNRKPRPADGTIWICPAAADANENPGGNYFCYAMNMRLSTWNAPLPDRIDRVGAPHTLVFMADAWGAYCSTLPSCKRYSAADRHRGNRVN